MWQKGAISSCLWALGDALIAEVGAPGKSGEHTGSDAKLKQAQKALDEAGYPYSWERLRDFRQVVNNFPLDLAGGRPPAWLFSLCGGGKRSRHFQRCGGGSAKKESQADRVIHQRIQEKATTRGR